MHCLVRNRLLRSPTARVGDVGDLPVQMAFFWRSTSRVRLGLLQRSCAPNENFRNSAEKVLQSSKGMVESSPLHPYSPGGPPDADLSTANPAGTIFSQHLSQVLPFWRYAPFGLSGSCARCVEARGEGREASNSPARVVPGTRNEKRFFRR